ncbi:MAG: hypothetical protein CMI60_19500 [Parvibaculum sp.]|nr:hypothetical protein [Parvibaculum sp.]
MVAAFVRAREVFDSPPPFQNLIQMKKKPTNPFLLEARNRYFEAIGLADKSRTSKQRWMKNRKRHIVEQRAALFNAVSPFCGRADCASMFNKDHATVLHAIKSHEMYLKYSANYGQVYEQATKIVADLAKEMRVYPMGQYRHYVSSESELESLQRTLDNLQTTLDHVKDRVRKNTNPVREYRGVLSGEE